MQITWKTYQEKSNTNSFIPFALGDNYKTPNIKDVKIKSNSDISEGVLFLARNLKEEVLNGTKKEQKKNVKQLRKLLAQFTMIAVVGLATTQPLIAEANGFMTTTSDITSTPEITPSTVMNWGLTIALIVVSVGVALSISLLAIAGIYLMITRKRQKTQEWTTDIIRGLVQVLISIPLVYGIFQLSQIVFRNLPFLEILQK